MARYRTYKNGITGHRYKGYYIIRGEMKGKFSILKEDKTIFMNQLYDYDECEWEIDKAVCSEQERKVLQQLYEKEIYQLSALFVDLMQKKEKEGLSMDEGSLYFWVEKIRRRKVEDRNF